MKCYLINLDRSPLRLAHFTQQAQALGLVFERIAAVDGRTLSAPAREAALAPRFQFQPLNAGEIGIFMSQRQAWQRLVDSGEPCAAVFEDDVELSANSAVVLQALAQRQDVADIVKLETTLRGVVLGEAIAPAAPGYALRRLLSWHGGAAAYLIQRAAAQRLLQATWPLADPVDQVLFHPMSSISAGLRLWQLCPALAVQKNILDRHQKDPAFQTTIDRAQTKAGLFRHGWRIDLARAWLKQRERWRRQGLVKRAGNDWVDVAFDDGASVPAPVHPNP